METKDFNFRNEEVTEQFVLFCISKQIKFTTLGRTSVQVVKNPRLNNVENTAEFNYFIRNTEGKKYCNRYYYSDAEPYEVIEETTAKMFKVRKMKAVLTEESIKELRESFSAGGFCGHTDNSRQRYTITPDESNPVIVVRLHKNGYWYEAGEKGSHFKVENEPYKWYDYNY